GVSYVTGKIATELWRHSGQAVLVATAASLCGLEPIHLESAGPDAPRNGKVWQLARTFPESELDSASLHAETVQLLRRRFDYVVIVCPAMKASTAVFPVATVADGVVMVVAAGEARRDEIEQAQSALQSASCNLLGFVLNKRTEPVPKL